jgi:hypothetical protein
MNMRTMRGFGPPELYNFIRASLSGRKRYQIGRLPVNRARP